MLDGNAISSAGGNLYIAQLNKLARWPFFVDTDGNGRPYASNLQLFENEKKLGPPHSLHADIAKIGAGSYSYFSNAVHFSASNNSDPRTNGNRYTFVAHKTLTNAVQRVLLLVTFVLNALVAFRLRDVLLEFIPIYYGHTRSLAERPSTILSIGGIAIVILSMAAFGVFGQLTFASPGPAKDTALVLAVAGHAVLGLMTSIGLWAAAAGLLRMIPFFRRASVACLGLASYPLILVMIFILSAVALMMPSGRTLAVVAWLCCLMPLLVWRISKEELRATAIAILAIAPLGLGFGLWQGLLWHGPTNTLQGSPSGDLIFYAGNVWALAANPYPNFNLGYENGVPITYFNQLYPAFGAALLELPGFDPFLFLLSSGSASYILFTFLALYFFISVQRNRILDHLDIAIVIVAFIAAVRYPYWIAESIPVVFAPALVISVWWMSEAGKQSAGWSVAAICAALLGSALSKVTSAITLFSLVGSRAASRLLNSSRATRLVLCVIGGIAAVYGAVMLMRFLPSLLAAVWLGPESFRQPQWYFTLRDLASLSLIGLAWLATPASVAISVTFGVASFLAYSFVTHINLVVVIVMFGLVAASSIISSRVLKAGVLASIVLTIPAALLAEPAGRFSSLVWVVCAGAATWVALSAAPGSRLGSKMAASIAASAIIVSSMLLLGAARGTFIVDSGARGRDILTPELKDIWSAVRLETPKDALIFTDQVDKTENMLGGWNTYAFSGQRHVFLSSYVTAIDLRGNEKKYEKVLAENDSVLSGTRSWDDLIVQHPHTSSYAVVSINRAVPSGWTRVHANGRYALYKIPAESSRK